MTANIPPPKEPKKPKAPEKPVEPPKNNRLDDFFGQFTGNIRDIVAYILLVLGILLLFVNHLYGGLLVGVVVGVYFSKEIVRLIQNIEAFIDRQGLPRSIILAGLLVAFLISAPAIFLGIALVVLLRFFILNEKNE